MQWLARSVFLKDPWLLPKMGGADTPEAVHSWLMGQGVWCNPCRCAQRKVAGGRFRQPTS